MAARATQRRHDDERRRITTIGLPVLGSESTVTTTGCHMDRVDQDIKFDTRNQRLLDLWDSATRG